MGFIEGGNGDDFQFGVCEVEFLTLVFYSRRKK